MDTNIQKSVVQAVFEPQKALKARKNTREGEEGEPRMDTNGHEYAKNIVQAVFEPRMDTNGTRKHAWMARLGAPARHLANSCVLLTLR